jgi:hypothetical protein
VSSSLAEGFFPGSRRVNDEKVAVVERIFDQRIGNLDRGSRRKMVGEGVLTSTSQGATLEAWLLERGLLVCRLWTNMPYRCR